MIVHTNIFKNIYMKPLTRIERKYNWRKLRWEHFWRTKSQHNGKIMARSENYFNRSECVDNMRSVANSLLEALKLE